MDMLERLEGISRHFDELKRYMTEPEIVNDTEKYLKILKEHNSLEEIVGDYRKYREALKNEEDALLLLRTEHDEEMIELCKSELSEARRNKDDLFKKLRIGLLPKDENDDRNVIMEIRGGAGGEEAALFAAELYRMYIAYCINRGWKTELVSVNETGIGGMKEVVFIVNGESCYQRLKYEAGVHRVQRVPVTETGGRIHTSTATVSVMPEAEEVDVDINPADVRMEVFRSSGAGGQHINKTSSAVRLIHCPTGLVAECQEERSQVQNREKAMRLLRARLYEIESRKKHEEMASEKRSQLGTGDRSEKIRTYNFPQGRVTDHRIGLSLYSIDKILNGSLDELLDPLISAVQAEKLAESEIF